MKPSPVASAPPPAAVSPPNHRGADGAGARFREVLNQAGPPAAGPTGSPTHAVSPQGPGLVETTIRRLAANDRRIDHVLRAATRGKTFSPNQLLALQAQVFRYSQTVEVISRTTDRLVGAVKQTLNTQV